MAGARKRRTYEEEVAALSAVAADPRSAGARALVAAALASERSLVVARAAKLVKEHQLDGFEAPLNDAFTRACREPGKKHDPSCHAKLATLEALDWLGSLDAGPFLRAARVVQFEGGDTAAPLRARAVLGLARIGHEDFDLVAARLIADPLPPVRQAALEALAHRGERAGAPLAALKLHLGDEDPLVTLAAMTTLLALAPAAALAALGELLDGEDATRRELAAVALGQSRRDDALALLLEALGRATRAEEREPLVRGIGLHRSDRALEALLGLIADGAARDATTAVEALSPRRFEPGLAERVRAAAARNDRADLGRVVDDTFAR